jgi:hypothetical protein
LTPQDQAANIDVEMAASTTLLEFLLMLVAGWLQRQQAATIDYLKAENCISSGAPRWTAHHFH